MNLELQKGSRSRILAGLVLGFTALFVVRLFYLQIVQHGYYVNIANQEQIKRLTIPAKRGTIFALDGDKPIPIVLNQTVYTVFADPQMVTEADKVVNVVRRIAGGNAKSDLDTLTENHYTRYQVLANKVTRVQVDKIKNENLKGVGFQQENQRVYPEGSLAAQTLGFLDAGGIGRYGIEGGLNDRLTGKDGLLQSVMDISDVPLTIGNKNINKSAVNGENIVLSIDRNIQSHTEQALSDGIKRIGANRGSVVVMDPQTGRVLAMTNLPTFDPAKYYEVKDAAAFNNNVVSAPYEPGSDVKTLTMATGIDRGAVTPQSTYVNTDKIQVEDRTITNATLGHTGTIDFQTAMNWSLNTGFVTIAERLDDGKTITRRARDIMYDYFHNKFKLGTLTGIEVSGEVTGTVIPPTSIEGNAVRYSNMAFGQGLDVTMIQVASAFSSLVNGGNYYKPSVIAGVMDKDNKFIPAAVPTPTRTVSKSAADQVKQMTHVARTTFYNYSKNDRPGYFIGGKTGTSQVIKNGVYSDDESVATYLGYGGSEETTRYVIMVQVSGDHKEFKGDMHAMPIFTDISNWIINYMDIKPKG